MRSQHINEEVVRPLALVDCRFLAFADHCALPRQVATMRCTASESSSACNDSLEQLSIESLQSPIFDEGNVSPSRGLSFLLDLASVDWSAAENVSRECFEEWGAAAAISGETNQTQLQVEGSMCSTALQMV